MHLTTRQDGGGFKLYHYDPTIAAAVVFVVAFGLTTLYHSWQMLRTRCWIATPLVLGGFLQVVGYLARAVSGNESPHWTLTPYIIQAIFLLIAPALYAATIYMEFGKIVTLVDGKQHTLMSHNWITKICVCGDVLSFVLQGGGGGYQSSGTLEALHAGANIIIIGLFVQLAFFGFFMVIALSWYVKMLRFSSSQAYCCPWKKLMYVLFGTSMLIMVRSVFRAAEYLEGDDGYLLAHEAYLYIFDALLMLAVMAILNVVHPSAATRVSTKHNETRDTLDLHLDRYYQDA